MARHSARARCAPRCTPTSLIACGTSRAPPRTRVHARDGRPPPSGMSQRAAGPLLSVVVPCHDASATLSRTLAAIVASDLPRELWELIVVDDASSDDTALIA